MHVSRNRIQILSLAVCYCLNSAVLADVNFTLFPDKPLYAHYLADPLRATADFQYMFYEKTTIADTSKRRFDIKLGGTFLLGEWRTSGDDTAFQLVLDGGFHGQFDVRISQDNIGWDGIYGLRLCYRHDETLAFTAGSKHISAHVGDEYEERTGRTRINYTREEYLLGLLWSPNQNTDVYMEAGHAFDMRNDAVQRPGRLQAGYQYQRPNTLWQNQLGWYAALDISAFEENDWHPNTTVQTGLYINKDGHVWRLGLELYSGRAQLGEFFQDEERYISLGLWYDL